MSDFITRKDWSPSYLFISRNRILLGLMFMFLGYKYQRPDYYKGYIQSNTRPFPLQPQTLGVGVKVDLDKTFDKSSYIG
jgi:hypothetical protein